MRDRWACWWCALVLGLPSTLHATVREYEAESGGHCRNTFSGQVYASLESARLTDAWAADDVINLIPGAYDTGALIINAERLQLNCANCLLYTNVSAPTQYTLDIRGSGVTVQGPATMRNTGVTGGVLRLLALQSDLTNVTVRDILIDQTNTGAISPVAISQANAQFGNRVVNNVVLENIVVDCGTGLPDVFALGEYPHQSGPSPTGYGLAYIVNCQARGGTQAPNSNALSVNTRMLAVIMGGVYSEAGGPTLVGTSSSGGRLFVFGAEVFRGCLHPDASGLPAEVMAEWVEGCFIHHAWNGVSLQTAYSPNAGLGICRNNIIVRDPARHTEGGIGIRSIIKTAIIEDCVVEGWNQRVPGGYDHDVAIFNAPNTNGSGLLVRRCWIKDAYKGIESYFYEAMIDLHDNLFTMMPAGGGLSAAAAVKVTTATGGQSQLRLANNVFVWEPSETVGHVVITGGTQRDSLGGGNYYWTNGNVQSDFEWQRYPSDLTATGMAARPLFDERGRQVSGSPAFPTICANVWTGHLNIGQQFGPIAIQSAASRSVIELASVPGPEYLNQTLLCHDGMNRGQWRRITSVNGATLTVAPALETMPMPGDHVVIRDPVLPSAGSSRVWDMDYYGFDTSLVRDFHFDCNTNGLLDYSPCEPDTDADGWVDGCDLCPGELAGDTNEDGQINAQDLPTFVSMLVTDVYHCGADVNSDGAVDGADIQPMVSLIQ